MRDNIPFVVRFVGVVLGAWCVAGCGDLPPSRETPNSGADGGAADAAPDTDVAPRADEGGACTVGASCGYECLFGEAPCVACGELVVGPDCRCRPRLSLCAPATGCDDPTPAREGEFCGEREWCNRPCAAGLSCTGVVTSDGAAAVGDLRRVCVPAAP